MCTLLSIPGGVGHVGVSDSIYHSTKVYECILMIFSDAASVGRGRHWPPSRKYDVV